MAVYCIDTNATEASDMNVYDFHVTLGSRKFVKRICAESYTIASNLVHLRFPASAIISPVK